MSNLCLIKVKLDVLSWDDLLIFTFLKICHRGFAWQQVFSRFYRRITLLLFQDKLHKSGFFIFYPVSIQNIVLKSFFFSLGNVFNTKILTLMHSIDLYSWYWNLLILKIHCNYSLFVLWGESNQFSCLF